jgi:hypothetical protein
MMVLISFYNNTLMQWIIVRLCAVALFAHPLRRHYVDTLFGITLKDDPIEI